MIRKISEWIALFDKRGGSTHEKAKYILGDLIGYPGSGTRNYKAHSEEDIMQLANAMDAYADIDSKSYSWHFRPHEFGGENRVRVWRNDWAGDMFDVLSRSDFETFRSIANGLQIPLSEAPDD